MSKDNEKQKLIKCQNVKKCIQKDIKNVHSVKNMPKML